jgi:hypothetical protein
VAGGSHTGNRPQIHVKEHEDEMGRAWRTHGREVRKKLWYETLKERNHKEDLDADGRIILKRTLKK